MLMKFAGADFIANEFCVCLCLEDCHELSLLWDSQPASFRQPTKITMATEDREDYKGSNLASEDIMAH